MFKDYPKRILEDALVSSDYHNKIPWTGCLKERKCTLHSSGSWRAEIRVPARQGLGGSSFSVLQRAVFSLCPHKAREAE